MVDMASFHCKKWTLFTLCLIGIVISIVITVVACNLIDKAAKPDDKTTDQTWKDAKKIAKGIIIAVGVITILIEMLGLFGAYKEHYCMTMTYAILMTLATIGNMVSAIQGDPSAWGSFVVSLLITIMAFLFARDLKQRRLCQPAQGYGA